MGGRRGRVLVVVERRYCTQAQPLGLVHALRARGVQVRVVDSEARAVRIVEDDGWLEGVDLVVVRGRTPATLALASWAETAGVPTLNSRAATESVRNKAELAVALACHGIASPATLVGAPSELAAVLEPDEYPVVLKPVFGDNGRGLRLVADAVEMSELHWPEPVAVAQRFVPSDGRDLKLYVIGSQVFAVRKPSPFSPWGRAPVAGGAERCPTTLEMRELALRCGRLFGLELFGVDCIDSPDGPLVIEINEYPNYTGVQDADAMLADLVLGTMARAAVAGEIAGSLR